MAHKAHESELMEQLPNGTGYQEDPMTRHIQLVSLGCYCGPKLSFKEMGRGAETLPFDWIRVSMAGLLHFFRTGFKGYFDWVSRHELPGAKSMVIFRSPVHSFWHDDPTDPAMRERYTRRLHRFSSLDAVQSPILFVRSLATSDEVPQLGELAYALRKSFGPKAKLLAILDFQPKGGSSLGPWCFQDDNSVMLYLFHNEGGSAPYCEPISQGLRWAAGLPVATARSLPSIAAAASVVTFTDFGLMANGLPVFEPSWQGWPRQAPPEIGSPAEAQPEAIVKSVAPLPSKRGSRRAAAAADGRQQSNFNSSGRQGAAPPASGANWFDQALDQAKQFADSTFNGYSHGGSLDSQDRHVVKEEPIDSGDEEPRCNLLLNNFLTSIFGRL
mmetsp:Transcript_36024/g.84478  ORF Transcript_36024/g.84478 Transcript_36024/m.84478 type:complete len:385 (-) Transcript_36024:204-1358(-)